jgi:hypothetical protein
MRLALRWMRLPRNRFERFRRGLGQATCPPAMSTLPLGIYRHGVVEIRASQGSTAAVGHRSTGNKDLPVCQNGRCMARPGGGQTSRPRSELQPAHKLQVSCTQ